MITEQDRYRGALLGLACGDAVGTTVEFRARGSFAPLTDMVGGGPFDLEAGQWTDDTSMGLCLAHSLLYRRGFDAVDQMNRYCNWYQHGYMSSTDECFDIGATISVALRKYLDDKDPFAGSLSPRAAGNGALMRLVPVPMYYAGDSSAVFLYSGESTRTTHGTREALECSRLFGLQLQAALMGKTKQEVVEVAYPEPLSAKVAALNQVDFLDKSVDQIKGSGYCVEALEAALWCFWHTGSYQAAVLRAANLGDDADTTAAIVGQLAGAWYGVEAIPLAWREKITMGDEIVTLADRLLAERMTRSID
jgi:ADP-ribosyl-[dinitrogen reductase] hydrolase